MKSTDLKDKIQPTKRDSKEDMLHGRAKHKIDKPDMNKKQTNKSDRKANQK